jgi:hypothetical protein
VAFYTLQNLPFRHLTWEGLISSVETSFEWSCCSTDILQGALHNNTVCSRRHLLHERQIGFECNETHHLLVFADEVNILGYIIIIIKKLNSMVWVRERTIPTERPPLVGEVIAKLCG